MSDHFDGKKFFNPTLVGKFYPGFSDVFRLMREPRAPWPKKVANEATPQLTEELGPGDIGITFVNHATFLIQVRGLIILTDPVWSERASPLSWLGPKRVRPPGVGIEELPKIDLILISHNHYDHLDTETLKKLHKKFAPRVIVPVGDKALIESLGIQEVVEMDWWDKVQIHSEVAVTFTPTQHSSARGLFDRDHSLWGSYFLHLGQGSVYFGGDAGYSEHYEEIKRRLGPPGVALLGIGAYEPRWFMQPLHMNPEEAVMAHKDLGARLSIGMHFGTFPMAMEAFDRPIADLKEALENQKVPESDFTTLQEGETRIFRASSPAP